MIDDLDQSLQGFLHAALGPAVVIDFVTPSPEWASSRATDVLSCFLHAVTEQVERRSADWIDERDASGRVTGRRPPVRHYRFHYVISAWSDTPSAEHRLLGAVMTACLGTEVLPASHLIGVLSDAELPVGLILATPSEPYVVQPHQVWASLSMPLHASLTLVLEAVLRPALDVDVAPEAKQIALDMHRLPAGAARPPAPTNNPSR
jgi:hypothetical protein